MLWNYYQKLPLQRRQDEELTAGQVVAAMHFQKELYGLLTDEAVRILWTFQLMENYLKGMLN